MKVQISKTSSGNYRANLEELPGSPPVGEGNTPEDAVASLFFRVLNSFKIWEKYINWNALSIEHVGDNAF